MTINLRDWQEQYVRAARANEIPRLRVLISELGAYLRDVRTPAASPSASIDPSASWQDLCLLAQDEKDPEKLMALVARINELLEQRQAPHRR